MSVQRNRTRTWLLAIAKSIANQLKLASQGTRMRIRMPSRATHTQTGGWAAVIGSLGKGRPKLEVWFDQYTGHSERTLFVGVYSNVRPQILSITKRVQKLLPVRTITDSDINDTRFSHMTKRLKRSEFTEPILEKYSGGHTWIGYYEKVGIDSVRAKQRLIGHASAFFESVARALPHATPEDDHRSVYPQYEDRKRVSSHLIRERSRLLSIACKERDNYTCQVCQIRFEDIYDELGLDFAESHHLTPLGLLRDRVKTRLEDLATVCSNCHRMLHRMKGKRKDVSKLKTIVRRMRMRRK